MTDAALLKSTQLLEEVPRVQFRGHLCNFVGGINTMGTRCDTYPILEFKKAGKSGHNCASEAICDLLTFRMLSGGSIRRPRE